MTSSHNSLQLSGCIPLKEGFTRNVFLSCFSSSMALFTLSAMALFLFLCPPASQAAEGDWEIQSNVQASYTNYSKSTKRKSMNSGGAMLSADYLDRGGFTMSGNLSQVKFKAGADVNQDAYYASGRYHTNIDELPGIITMRMDTHFINNNDPTGNTNNVKIIAPHVSFLNYEKTFYLDFSYTHSIYQNQLTVSQYTPTIGFAFNEQSDWLQIRGYFIDPSNPLRAQNKSSTMAAEIKWSHWFAPDNLLGLEMMTLQGLVGERLYAVDGDAAAVYNLSDIQKGSVSLGLQWAVTDSSSLLLVGGMERFLDNTISNTYDSQYLYANFSTSW